MIRAIIWKEWREHRLKYAAFWLVLNLPMLVVAAAVALNHGARAPFADLSNATAVKYLGVALIGQSFLLVSVFLLVSGFLAVATFTPELENRSVFFFYEQPVSRARYIGLKLLNGALHVVAAVTFAALFAPVVAYALILAGGKVTAAGSLGLMGAVMAAAARTALWCSLLALVAFTASALVAALMPRWWLATAGSIAVVVLGGMAGANFFDFIGPAFEQITEGSLSVQVGSAPWLTVTTAIPVHALAPWRALPLLTALLLTAICAAGTGVLYTRKELK